MMADGSWKYMKDVQPGDKLVSWDGKDLVTDEVENVWCTGKKECTRSSVFGARDLCLTPDHRVLSYKDGCNPRWERFDELKNRSMLCVSSIESSSSNSNKDVAAFLGYLMSDASTSNNQQPKFTNGSHACIGRVKGLAQSLGYKTAITDKGNAWDVRFIGGGSGGLPPNPVAELCKEHGIRCHKKDKRIPKIIWESDAPSTWAFLSAVFDSDGCIYIQPTGRQANTYIPPKAEVKISVGESEELAWDYYWLLRKMGVHAAKVYNDRDWCWTIRIWEDKFVRLFCESVSPSVERKVQLCDYAINLPIPKRNRSLKLDNFYISSPKHKENVLCDTYDITMKTHANFIADGYVVHNCGKEVVCWNLMIFKAIHDRVGTYVYFFPTSRLGKRIIWDGANKDGKRFIHYIPQHLIKGQPNSVEMKIELTNGSVIQIVGTDSIINVGINPIGCVFSEYSLQDPKAWTYIRPILRENDGWAVFNGTPRGRNHLYDIFSMAERQDDWFAQKLTIEDTGVLTDEDMDKERQEGMSEDLILQEYYCSWDLGVEGSYYAKYLNKAELEGRVGKVPYDPAALVHTAWDLGVSDSTSIVFFQLCGNEIHIIDYYENQGEGLEHYAKVIDSKDYLYGNHWAPHDIEVRELGAGGVSRRVTASKLGIRFKIVPKHSVLDGIEAVRGIFPRLWIDNENCKYLIKCVENYHKKFNEKLNVYSDNPVHDWSSHCADAVRYMAVTQRLGRASSSRMSEEEANRLEQMYSPKHR